MPLANPASKDLAWGSRSGSPASMLRAERGERGMMGWSSRGMASEAGEEARDSVGEERGEM
jgi:hypothetical protein